MGAAAQQPAGVPQTLAGLVSQPASHAAFTFDRNALDAADGLLESNGGPPVAHEVLAALNSITVETYRYNQPAFYTPEGMAQLIADYNAAGWKHLVNANGNRNPQAQTMPLKPITDLWLHFHGATIDDVTVLVRAPRQMNVVEISGQLRPLDLVHLSGHFGIPKVDPDAVMVPAEPGH